MISFRFHVVSITAVFLAIAIGIVVGSTYVDRAIVENLRNRVDSVSDNLDERRAEIATLEGDLGDAQEYIQASADFAVSGSLTDQPVLIAATRGVDAQPVEEIATLARRAGAVVPGVLWLEPSWALADDGSRERLSDLVGGHADDDPASLQAAAWDDLAAELAAQEPSTEEASVGAGAVEGQADPTTTTTTAPAPTAPVLTGLQEAGFVTLDPVGDTSVALAELAGSGSRVLLVTGDEGEETLQPAVPVVVDALAAGEVPTVVADVHIESDDGPERGQRLAEALPDPLRDEVVLVDDADRIEGQVSAVLALRTADSAPGTHFGLGSGADGRLPAWTPP
jgi:hypothetical protein